MIRTLRLSDLPRQLFSGQLHSNDLVSTHLSLHSRHRRFSQVDLARWAMPTPRQKQTIGAFERSLLVAVALIQPRSHASAWEVAHLFSSAQGYAQLDDLMRAGASAAARHGADRLFLLSPDPGPAVRPAERTGFRRVFAEQVFTGLLSNSTTSEVTLRRVERSDVYKVFRLHAAALPSSARQAVGITLEQWAAARERATGRTEEFVWDTKQGLMAWLWLNRHGTSVTVEAMLHPACADRAGDLVEGAAQVAGYGTRAKWIVPGYEPFLAKALSRRGWRPDNRYDVFVRPIASRVEDLAMIPAQA